MYMLNALERHHKVVTTSGKLEFSLSPEFSSWGRVSKKKKKTCQVIFFCTIKLLHIQNIILLCNYPRIYNYSVYITFIN